MQNSLSTIRLLYWNFFYKGKVTKTTETRKKRERVAVVARERGSREGILWINRNGEKNAFRSSRSQLVAFLDTLEDRRDKKKGKCKGKCFR